MSVLLYGAGGHAKVVIDCLATENRTVVGIFDDDLRKQSWYGIPVVGPYRANLELSLPLILSVGDNFIRHRIALSIQHAYATTIYSSALLSPTAAVGDGTVVFHRAVIQAAAQIGQHVIINTAAIIEHDCVVENFAHVAPGAVLCGGVRAGEGTLIGAGAVLLPGISVGKWCVVGAGAIVTRSIPDYSMAVGNPASIRKRTNDV